MEPLKPLQIAFILNHFYPELGAVRTEFEIANKLAEKNNVTVITTFPRKYRLPKGYRYNYPKAKPVIIEYINRMKVLRIAAFKSRMDEPRQRLIELLTGLASLLLPSIAIVPLSDVVLVAGDIELLVSQIGIIAGKIWRKPVVVILHDIHPDVLIRAGIIKNKFIIKLSEILIKVFSKYVDRVIVHSYTNARILASRYNMDPGKIKVVELWANIDEIRPVNDSQKKALKRRYIEDADKVVVSFAGVMNPPQGLEVVIQAAHILKYNHNAKNILFLLVGDGMEKPRLQRLTKELGVEDIVRFLPLQPREKYIEVLQLSDICLVTLRKDYIQPVVPSKLLEIMAAGCPAVLSMPPHSDAVKIVQKYQCGIYAGAGDPQKLANTILHLANNKKYRETLAQNARKAAEEYFNLQRAAQQYQQILSELAQRKRPTHVA